jgi:hypothetical protein
LNIYQHVNIFGGGVAETTRDGTIVMNGVKAPHVQKYSTFRSWRSSGGTLIRRTAGP